MSRISSKKQHKKKNVALNLDENREIKKTKKKLSYEEKCLRNNKLYKDHIVESTIDGTSTFSCRSCPQYPATVSEFTAKKHAATHSDKKKA